MLGSDWCVSRQLWWGHQIPAYQVKLPDSTAEQEVSGHQSGRAGRSNATNILNKDLSQMCDVLMILSSLSVGSVVGVAALLTPPVRPSVCLTGDLGLWAERGRSAPPSCCQMWS